LPPEAAANVGSTVKPISTITGHNILPYIIHGGKSVPSIRDNTPDVLEEGDYVALEPFGSTGTGRLVDEVRALLGLESPR
jgi:methionyl aminopeptidase